MCKRNACQFRSCFNWSASSIFCKNISDRFQRKTTSTLTSNHSTSDVIFASRSTIGNYEQDLLPSTNDNLQKSGKYIPLLNSKNLFLTRCVFFIIFFLSIYCFFLGFLIYCNLNCYRYQWKCILTISLLLTIGFISLFLCVVGVVFHKS